MIEIINPATGEKIATYPEMTVEELNRILESSGRVQQAWRETSFQERATKLKSAGRILRENSQKYAELMAREMGKPLAQGQGEIEKCARVCDFYAEEGERMLQPEIIKTDASKSYVRFDPLGVVLTVMPWNFPYWQLFRCAAPILMAGNGMILKHAANVTGCALSIEDVFKKAGFPADLFRTVVAGSDKVAGMIEHPAIKAVTLTGGTKAGKAIASKAGQMLKKTVLELGGSDPYLVLEDAELDPTVEACVASRLINGGQSCIAAKRFIVVDSIREPFERRFVELMRAQQIGDPLQEGVTMGPLARHDLRDALHRQVQESVQRGAHLLLGGTIPAAKGAYYPPTVLTDVRKGMPVYEEETFGPVAAIIPVKNEAEAIRVANDSSFGLGAAIFTRDQKRGERLAVQEVVAGSCFVNAFVRSDPRLPLGGIKQSGYGRELSHFGIREFVNVKTIYIK